MQLKFTLSKVLKRTFIALFLFSTSTGVLNAQTFVNGNLSTGATTSNGVAAPAGYTWSEVQVGNTNAGFGANIGAGLTLADNFVVPAGPSWTISDMRFYGYSTGYAGTTSPFNDIRVRIFNTDPSVGSPTPIYGDLTTNRYVSGVDALMYRIFTATAGTTRKIWELTANVNVTLAPGTYWVEWQLGTVAAGASNFTPASTVVGTATQPGNNAKQHTLATNAWVNLVDGPTNPQDIYFKVNYTTGACTGTPVPGNTLTTAANICPGLPFTLSLQNATSGSGVTYQWQSGPSATGPWTNISTATNSTYTGTLSTATTYYQALVTCSGNTGTSTPVAVNLNPPSSCYCTAGATSTAFEKISRVQYANVNRASTSTAGYENFLTDTAVVEIGAAVPITVTLSGGFSSDRVSVWIDLNQDGDFTDPGENVYTSANGVGPHTGTITIPAGSLTGNTRMRVRMWDTALGANATPCGTSTYGQVEDYTVKINPCIPVTVTSQPVNRTIECGSNTTFNFGATGTGLTYLWEQRNNATSQWNNLTNTGVYSGVTTNTLTITNASVAMNGYQYRVIYTGGCSGTEFSNIVTLTVNPMVPTITPTSANICNGQSTQFTLTNILAPTQSSQSFTSGPLTLAIPDNSTAGVNNTIPVTLPTGAQIVGLSVTLNATHTWVGDLVFVLKAPNGAVFNLDYYLTGTGGAGNNMVNTVISSTGTAALSSGTAPWTGTFRADAAAATANPPSGPTGFVPTVTAWSGLYSTPSGNWTLAVYDGGAADVGTLTSWSLNVTYLAGLPATGVFTPTTGLFTNAALTTPYTGTAVNTIYAAPTTTTTYSVTITTPNCVSSPLSIPVTVNNPITGTSTTSNASACVGGNASFTASAPTSGGTIQHQWKVSTDNGATFTNVTNGGVYSGATTATLNITGATSAMNNYKYKDSLYVTSCNSSITTNTATLTVNPNPVIVLSSNPYNSLFPGLTTTLTAAVSPNAAATYTWYQNGVVIPGATGNTFVVDVDHLGEYSVTVDDVNGCTASSNMISIGDSTNDVMFIYPSPNDGQFQVRYFSENGNNALPRTLTVYDSKGARVFTRTYTIAGPYTSMDVDMSNFSTGIYMVELGDRSGRRIKTGRVVIR